jgi:hypothetical protein
VILPPVLFAIIILKIRLKIRRSLLIKSTTLVDNLIKESSRALNILSLFLPIINIFIPIMPKLS